MRKLTLLLICLTMRAQQPSLNLVAAAPQAPTGIVITYTGPAGPNPQPVFYWVVARYGTGLSPSVGTFSVSVPGGVAAVSPTQTVRISFSAPPAASGFDILRSGSSLYPGGGCTACAALVNVSGSPQTDVGAVNPYPPSGMSNAQGASGVFTVNNTDSGAPFPQISLNGQSPRPFILGPVPPSPPSGPAGGDLGGNYPNPTVTNGSHITNASIPNSGLVNSQTTVNGTPCFLGATCTPGSGPPSGAAGGDLGSTYPNPTVVNGAHITNGSIPNSGLVNSQTTVNGTPCVLGASCTPGGGPPSGAAGGDLGSTYPNPTVTNASHITNSSLPNSGLVNPSTTVNGTVCTLGSTCTPTAAPTGAAGGDLGSTYPNPTVTNASHITNSSLPNSGLVNPSTTVNGTVCTLGSTCTPTAAPTGAAGGDLGSTYPNPTVTNASHITNSSLPNSGLVNPSTTVNGTVCTLGSTCTPSAPTNQTIRTIGASFGSFQTGATALTAAATACVPTYFAGTIQAVEIIGNVSGSATIDVQTVLHSAWTGTASVSSITAAATPNLSSASKYTDTTLTGWTTTIAAGTDVCFVMTSPTTVAGLGISLKVAAQ